jgi:hypothetical protein
MMNWVVYSLIISIFSLDYLVKSLKIAPRIVTLAPEVIGLFVVVVVLIRIIHNRKLSIGANYIVLICLYIAGIVIGIILSFPSIVTVLIGLRVHMKFMPYFLLPAVCAFSNREVRMQLLVFLGFLLLQFPVTFFQRFVQLRHAHADFIAGTVGITGMLSIVMVCSISVLISFYLKKKISRRFFIVAGLCLFLPTTINETKITLFLIPIALVAPPFFLEENRTRRMRGLFLAAISLTFVLGAYLSIFEYIDPRGQDPLSVLESEKEFNRYFFPGRYGYNEGVRRGDSILLAFQQLSKDPAHFFFGVGVGNVTRSFDKNLKGEYTERGRRWGAQVTAFSNLFWEIGLLGFIAYGMFYFFIFKDVLILMKLDDLFGALALGWTSVVLIFSICLVYNNYIQNDAVNLSFWYLSGVLASRIFRMRELARVESFIRPPIVHAPSIANQQTAARV